MVSGPRADCETVKPALDVIGKSVLHRREAGRGPDDETCQQLPFGHRDGGNVGSGGDGRQGRARSGRDDRRHQRRFRPRHGQPRQVSARGSAAQLRFRFCDRADGEGLVAHQETKSLGLSMEVAETVGGCGKTSSATRARSWISPRPSSRSKRRRRRGRRRKGRPPRGEVAVVAGACGSGAGQTRRSSRLASPTEWRYVLSGLEYSRH